MGFQLSFTDNFKKHYEKLNQKEKTQTKSKIELLADNPMHPSLRSKRIQGADNLFESSCNMDIRIIWFYVEDGLIVLVDIGHHDILK